MINSTQFLRGTTALLHGAVGYADEVLIGIGVALAIALVIFLGWSIFSTRKAKSK